MRLAGHVMRVGPAGPPRRQPFEDFDAAADAAAAQVIGRYSSSFGLASRLLGEPVRRHVRNVYALVRLADELVDAPRPGAGDHEREAVLATLREETLTAMGTGHSSNLVVHAFARTARACAIEPGLVEPFFASMRSDLHRREHDAASFVTYVHGSAEVVGLMCLRAFTAGPGGRPHYDRLAPGARRLGAAFQKVNFLRDLADDRDGLGRSYFPGIDPRRLDDTQRDRLLDDVDADLAVAAVAIAHLPRSSRLAVCTAHDLFAELSARLRATPARVIREQRVRVPGPVKARLVAAAALRGGVPRAPGRSA